ncbi:hypothetical protein QYF36_024851 [Acer negundo]|nr:hypothetical protein QYF36_024851 [Acer negundo]
MLTELIVFTAAPSTTPSSKHPATLTTSSPPLSPVLPAITIGALPRPSEMAARSTPARGFSGQVHRLAPATPTEVPSKSSQMFLHQATPQVILPLTDPTLHQSGIEKEKDTLPEMDPSGNQTLNSQIWG